MKEVINYLLDTFHEHPCLDALLYFMDPVSKVLDEVMVDRSSRFHELGDFVAIEESKDYETGPGGARRVTRSDPRIYRVQDLLCINMQVKQPGCME